MWWLFGIFTRFRIDLGINNDPVLFWQAIEGNNFNRWINSMKDMLKSMEQNEVCDLVKLSEASKKVVWKRVFKTKHDSTGNIERHKAGLVANGFTQKNGIDHKETFLPVSRKDSLRIIMTLVAHYDLKLYQMDGKITFLNENL